MSPDEENRIYLKLEGIGRDLVEVSKAVVGIEARLPAAESRLDHADRRAHVRLDDLDRRLRVIEKRVWLAIGALAVFGFVWPQVAPYIFPAHTP